METIKNTLTATESILLIELKERIEKDTEALKVLTDKLKGSQEEDGIVLSGIVKDGEEVAFVLYSQNRINDKKFNEAYPQNKHANMYKVAPDTVKIRKNLTEDQIEKVSTPVRALRVSPVSEAVAAAEAHKKD